MLIIGLTGSIGMGKSTAAERFLSHGIAVSDSDAVVHDLYRGAAVAPIEATFPGTTDNGKVDRQKLLGVLLATADGFKRLEALVHPMVRTAQKTFLDAQARKGASVAVLEIPLLFETGGDKLVDYVVVVSAPADVQRQRVLQRPGMTVKKLDGLLKRQTPDAEKREKADFIVDTSGSIEQSGAQVDRIIAQLVDTTGTAYDAIWSRVDFSESATG